MIERLRSILGKKNISGWNDRQMLGYSVAKMKRKLVHDAGNIETMCMCLVSTHDTVALYLNSYSLYHCLVLL